MSCLDNLECEHFFLKTILNIKEFEKYLKTNNVKSGEYEKGYYLLIELGINNLIHAIEDLISDDLSELINWNWNITSKSFGKNIKTESKDIDFIKGLESFRNKIENKRLSKSKSDINATLRHLINMIDKIKEYYFNNIKYTKNKNIKKQEIILFLIANSKPHLKSGYDEKSDSFEFSSPADYFYNLLPMSDREKYSFDNDEIKSNRKKYIKGFAITLSYIFENKVDSNLLNSFKLSNSWREIHLLGCRIRDEIVMKSGINPIMSIYEVDYSYKNKNYIKKISSENDLKILLRNREIILQNIDYINESSVRNGYDETFPILFRLVLYSLRINEKAEIIEFKYNISEVDYTHSYLIYIGFGTSLANSSYWLLFKDTALSAKDGYKSNGKMQMDILLEEYKEKFNYKSYSIEPKLFNNYLSKHCTNYVKKVMLENSLKESNSMLNELIHLYVSLKMMNQKVIHIDWGHKFENGEIDSLIVTEKEIQIIQSKTRNTEIKSVKKHFNNVIRYLPKYFKRNNLNFNNKKIIKKVFSFEISLLSEEEVSQLVKDDIQILNLREIIEKNKNILDDYQYDKLCKTILI